MPKFRKKPVVIDAIQWLGDNLETIITFTDGALSNNAKVQELGWAGYKKLVALRGFKIYTLEGVMNADVGDWIIIGVKGELYPCKPGIFEKTYDVVKD